MLFFCCAGLLCADVLIEIRVIFIFRETDVALPSPHLAASPLILIAALIARDKASVSVSVLTVRVNCTNRDRTSWKPARFNGHCHYLKIQRRREERRDRRGTPYIIESSRVYLPILSIFLF